MTITLHSLQYSRAVRIAWLMEELSVPYKIVRYERTDAYQAPPGLRQIHPLGKAPVIVDGDLVLGESAAILRHVQRRHGDGRFVPEGDRDAWARHDEWLDYVEGTLMRPISAAFWARRNDSEIDAKSQGQLDLHMGHLNGHLAKRDFLLGDALTLADMQMLYALAMARYAGVLGDGAAADYLDRLLARPAVERAIKATGPIMPDG